MIGNYVFDSLGVIGLGLVAWGLGWMYPPLAPTVIGAALVLVAVLGARRKARKEKES